MTKFTMKFFTSPRWPILMPLFFYVTTMILVLYMSFPLRSSHLNTKKILLDEDESYDDEIVDSNSNNNNDKSAYDYDAKGNEIKESKEEIIIKTAFSRADKNNDDFLSMIELSNYINAKIKKHIDRSITMNPILFAEIDIEPHDNTITWEEYHKYFLRKKGLDEDYINRHNEKKHVGLDRKSLESMMRDKAIFSDASNSEIPSLTLDEFLYFRHPESSKTNLLSLVDEILRQFDVDGDDNLTIQEFTDVIPNELFDTNGKKISQNSEERRNEFRNVIDRNNDGKADKLELLEYLDPRNPRHAKQETITLFTLADTDHNNKLSLQELLNKSHIFLSSKMINMSENFHDDF